MKKFNSNNRIKVLSRSVAFSRALCAVKNIAAFVKNRRLAAAAIVAAMVSTAAVAAVLTPPFGILSAPVFVRASFADPTDVKFKVQPPSKSKRYIPEQEVIAVNNARETVMQQIVLAPGGNTGWHTHPGPVVVLIKSGQMSFYDENCMLRTYSAGQAFVDSGQGDVHIARNESQSENLEIWATYFDVPPGGAFRIDAPSPGICGF